LSDHNYRIWEMIEALAGDDVLPVQNNQDDNKQATLKGIQDFILSLSETAYWDDLRFPATAINPPGAVSDPDRDATDGTLLFAPSGTEVIFCTAQLPHKWKQDTIIKPHVHWCKTTSAAGNVVWGMQYKIYSVGDVAGAFSAIVSSSTTAGPTADLNTAEQHLITPLGDIDMTGEAISTMLIVRIARLGNDAGDTYGADARLLEFDIHYEVDSLGSLGEFTKQT